MTGFYLDGPCILEVEGQSADWEPVSAYLKQELAPFEHHRSAGCPAVRLKMDDSVGHSPRTVYGVSGGRLQSGLFVVPDGSGHWCHFDPGSLDTVSALVSDVTVCCGRFNPGVLLDWILLPIAQFSHAAMGIMPLHASAASIPHHADPFVFSAWSGVGKTNLVLHAMQQGGGYFGDDRVHVDTHGYAHPSTRRVSIYGYNRKLAPMLSSRKQRRLRVGEILHTGARQMSGRAGFVASYAANGLGSTRASAAELGGVQGSIARVRGHVLCQSSSELSSQDEPVLERVSIDGALGLARSHAAVMEYEFVWFQRFVQTWRWAMGVEHDPWRSLMLTWDTNLAAYFERVPQMYRMTLPHGSPVSVAPRAWTSLLSSKLTQG